MYDKWVEDVEEGKLVGVMMIDLSAAFDMVDHPLLLKKLHLFGLNECALKWMESYLSGRSQSVLIDGCMSPPLRIECGVPQGSILGPLMYILFTNDIPDLVHDHNINFAKPQSFCEGCGGTVCYVDDATFSVADKNPATLSIKLSEQYETIADYMAANKLVINGDKTHLLVMGSKTSEDQRRLVSLSADQHIVTPSSTEKLLGCQISEDLKWKQHILLSDQSLTKQLTSRVNGLCLISSSATFETRLMVANGIFLSKLCYLIQLWGGCDQYLLTALQTLRNRAARTVTGLSWFTPARVLLNKCKWLSVRQLVVYQSILLAHKIATKGTPISLAAKMNTAHPYRTRQASTGSIRFGEQFPSTQGRGQNSFCYRSTKDYNSIPAKIRSMKSLPAFKAKLKQWILMNIPTT